MNGKGNWFRQLGQRIRAGMTRFMSGRYGTDKLNMAILTVAVVICLLQLFIPSSWAIIISMILGAFLGVFFVELEEEEERHE